MPNPKRRQSRSRTGKRRAHDHLTLTQASVCSQCGASVVPHRACRSCGYYKDREVIEVDSE